MVVSNKEKIYQVFISSTYDDLKEERSAVMQTLLCLNCMPICMELFPASAMSQMEYIKKMIDKCDYYILISAGRYGCIDKSENISYTEIEYNYAIEKKIPIMTFLYEDIKKIPVEKSEETEIKKEALNNFRKKVSENNLVAFYSSKEELQIKVANSLRQCMNDFPAAGWIRADNSDVEPALEKAIEKYLKENTITKDDIDSLFDGEEKDKTKTKIQYEPNEAGGNTVIIK